MNAQKQYARFDWESLEAAMKNLSHGGFRLWVYLCRNKDGFEFGLSGAAVKEVTGISKTTYQNAVQELLNKGYLVWGKLKNGIDGLIFYEEGYQKFQERCNSIVQGYGGTANDNYWCEEKSKN